MVLSHVIMKMMNVRIGPIILKVYMIGMKLVEDGEKI